MLPTETKSLLGAGTLPFFEVQRSLRFRASASAYLNRTPASSGNLTTWTLSAWIKRGASGTYQWIISGYTGLSVGNADGVRIQSNDTIDWIVNGSRVLATTQVFRDFSAFYHLVFVWNTTSSTTTITGSPTDRLRIYVNGVQVSSFSTTVVPAQNTQSQFNQNYTNRIGCTGTAVTELVDGYMSEVTFIDGQQLDPSYFGYTDPTTGVWMPKKYSGASYGTNGFYLTFQDNSAATAAAIGKDWSGVNTNNWTPNGISVSAGATYDSMLDVPTNWSDGGNGRGNYATLNPLATNSTYSLSNANLSWSFSASTASNYWSRSTFAVNSGKWYWEINVASEGAGQNLQLGIQSASTSAVVSGSAQDVGSGYAYIADGTKVTGTTVTAYGTSYTANDVVCVALDLDNGAIYFGKQTGGTGSIAWQNSGDPTSGASKTGAAFTSISGTYAPLLSTAIGGGIVRSTSGSFNFGQRPFSATIPTGYKALNTQNLPTPTILNGANYMAATTYTGTNATLNISNQVNSGNNLLQVPMQPDFVWTKIRSGTGTHVLLDVVRGNYNPLFSNLTNAEATASAGTGITSFNSNGYTLGTDISTSGSTNANGSTYVGWQWQAGKGSSSIPSGGTITPSGASINQSAGFSIITYTGNGTSGATVPHGLGVAPSMIIAKWRTGGTTQSWPVYHASIGATNYLSLNTTNASAAGSSLWNNTAPDSTKFTIGNDTWINSSTWTYVAYCFAAVAGYSAFGSYTGNGSTDGPFVFCGFRPRWVMIKRTDTADDWIIFDTSRNLYNVENSTLFPDGNYSETTDTNRMIDTLSNGFKVRSSPVYINASGGTYIYAAFAENPFKVSRAR